MTTPDPLAETRPQQVLSGGQTGVDRAALDVALELGIPCGGWCPRGRRAEDGTIDLRYPLQETEGSDYADRTKRNVLDSDATLVITVGPPTNGSALTIAEATAQQKPCLVVDLRATTDDPVAAREWSARVRPARLNVAGPRESDAPGVYYLAQTFLRGLWSPGASVAESGE